MYPLRITAFVLLAALTGCQDDADLDTDALPADTIAAGADAAPLPASAPGALLDPDAATREELLAVPGLDAALVDSLVARRPFTDMRDVDRVLAGRLSEEQRDTVFTRLWRPLDPNTASAEEILLIPGVGPRMQHEFEEYRPWRGIEHFRREIGKYVDAGEVARLEKYIVIRPEGAR